jgi:hypothetical protein
MKLILQRIMLEYAVNEPSGCFRWDQVQSHLGFLMGEMVLEQVSVRAKWF